LEPKVRKAIPVALGTLAMKVHRAQLALVVQQVLKEKSAHKALQAIMV
jgi:hypothetical protein